jgi:hypothetical protein
MAEDTEWVVVELDGKEIARARRADVEAGKMLDIVIPATAPDPYTIQWRNLSMRNGDSISWRTERVIDAR